MLQEAEISIQNQQLDEVTGEDRCGQHNMSTKVSNKYLVILV